MPTQDVELGYFAHPGKGAWPGVVMIHDVWGLSDHTRDMARRLAAEEFAVLAVDLYRREGEVSIEDPGAWMRALSDPRVLADVQAAVDFLRENEACNGRRVGVTGFCMGGTYAVLSACGLRDVSGAVAFYGLLSHEHGLLHDPSGADPTRKPRQPLDAVADLSCPLLAIFGGRDEYVPAADVERLRRAFEGASLPTEVLVYPEAGHAFLNDTRPEAYREEDARDAWAKMLAFFRANL